VVIALLSGINITNPGSSPVVRSDEIRKLRQLTCICCVRFVLIKYLRQNVALNHTHVMFGSTSATHDNFDS